MTPYLLVDGVRVAAEAIQIPHLRFRLRLPVREIRLISGAACPAELEASADRRQLGVLLRGLRWTQGDELMMDVAIDSPSFIDGFHAVEIHEPEAGPVRWTTGDAALPPALFPPWQGEALLHLALGAWQGSSNTAPVRTEAALLGAFESLGEDCEFGYAQRHYLVEPPLSLLRWAGISAEKLIQGLDGDFAGLGEPSTTNVVWSGEEYFLRTPYLTMHTNCKVEQNAAGVAEVLSCGRATLRILRRKLLKDIADARRIFVFRTHDPDFGAAGMHRLLAAMRRIGPASLLCVTIARPGQRIGRAERLADGLYAGYVEPLPHAPPERWVSICAETLRLYGRG